MYCEALYYCPLLSAVSLLLCVAIAIVILYYYGQYFCVFLLWSMCDCVAMCYYVHYYFVFL